ncbi:MAG: hypothetical protein AAGK14_00895 [Verrucomicrobiota bacterium]
MGKNQTYTESEKKLPDQRPHRHSIVTTLALGAALALGGTPALQAGPKIQVNGNLITRPNEALPLKVIHGKAIRLGDDLPDLTADLFDPVYLHGEDLAVNGPEAPEVAATPSKSPSVAADDSFYDPNRGDDLPVKERASSGPIAIATQGPAPLRRHVRVATELPRLDPMITGGRLNLMQIPMYVASLRDERRAEEAMATSGLFADLTTSRQDLPELTELPNLAPETAETGAVTTASTADVLLASTDASMPAPSGDLDGVAAPTFSLASVAREKAFLNSAWIDYDGSKEEFKATWSKPPLFHYGMVLLPELAKRVETGQEVEFRYQGMPAFLTKDNKGRLFVKHAGEARLITAGRLKKLLEEKIETDGMILFLDRQGNLVLHASGQNALVMNRHAGK